MHPSATCNVCNNAVAKYKCPTCRLPFCSVACSKQHKQTPCAAPPPPLPPRDRPACAQADGQAAAAAAAAPPLADHETALTAEQVSALRSSARVAAAARDPALQAVVRRIDGAPDPAAALAREMADPDFERFADELLEAIGVGEVADAAEAAREAAAAELRRLLPLRG